MCSIPIIFNDFKRNLFDVNFLFNYYTRLCHELLELFHQKKIVLNAFRVSTSLVVGTGIVVGTGVLLSMEAFGTMNSFKLLVSEDKKY